ncbi:unnamed protein product [Paramecium sonneborni]|uniref:Uncharacterized protein n=1 Tax=Paramecium sonneborni TaxID=65129 RepID=A0A8S1Q6M4_9CILI|nr:unnamed protein product [Paramecium sonneborni]
MQNCWQKQVYCNIMISLIFPIQQFIESFENFIQSYEDREQFVKEYNRIFINNKILQFVRQDYSKKVIQMIYQRSNQSASQQRYLFIRYSIKIMQLITSQPCNRNKRNYNYIIFKEQNIKIIEDYEQTRNKKSVLDTNDQLILRYIHIGQSDGLFLIREIQYSDIKDVELVKIKLIQKSEQESQIQILQKSFFFFHYKFQLERLGIEIKNGSLNIQNRNMSILKKYQMCLILITFKYFIIQQNQISLVQKILSTKIMIIHNIENLHKEHRMMNHQQFENLQQYNFNRIIQNNGLINLEFEYQ